MKKYIIAFAVVFGLISALAVALYSIQKPKEIIPNKAATQSGTVGFRLIPGTSTLNAGSSNIVLNVDIPTGTSVDGFQVVASVSGTVPADLAFTPQTPDGMQMVLNELTKTAGSATLKLAYITQSPQNPYTRASTFLGSFTFTSPATGQMALAFDNVLTKVVSHGSALDIASITPLQTYTFGAATASPSPTASPTTTASPTASPTGTCTRGNQSITLTPSTQSGTQGQALTYTVKVTNNDDKNCAKADFTLYAILPYSDWSANFAQSVLSIAPQTSSETTVRFTSSKNSPTGTLPVGVNSVGPKSSVVAAANYQVTQAATATTKPVAKATPQVVTYTGGTESGALASPSATPEVAVVTETATEGEKPAGILSNIPQAVIYALGGALLIVLFFILRALFGKKDNNPPRITPPSETPPAPVESTPPVQQTPMNMNQPSISHSVEAPIQN